MRLTKLKAEDAFIVGTQRRMPTQRQEDTHSSPTHNLPLVLCLSDGIGVGHHIYTHVPYTYPRRRHIYREQERDERIGYTYLCGCIYIYHIETSRMHVQLKRTDTQKSISTANIENRLMQIAGKYRHIEWGSPCWMDGFHARLSDYYRNKQISFI